MKPTLFILAAGMGSRYGGLKQLDGLGPNGETIMDFSVYDAVQAGFGKIVYVIRKDFEADFRAKVVSKYEHLLPIEIVFQSVDCLPEGYTCPMGRTKPWGTNHAVLMGRDVIREPFAVINADDYYGQDSFRVLADFLRSVEGQTNQYAMVGYHVGNTLSESGTVSRGVCEVSADGYLTGVVERTAIQRNAEELIAFRDEHDQEVILPEDTPVSMNMWGFTPDYFDHSEAAFRTFLDAHIDSPKGEFYIPTVVNNLIQSGVSSCRVLDTTSKWFGVTYPEDRPGVVAKFAELMASGTYPSQLY